MKKVGGQQFVHKGQNISGSTAICCLITVESQSVNLQGLP